LASGQDYSDVILQTDTTQADTVRFLHLYTLRAEGTLNQYLDDTLVHYYNPYRSPEYGIIPTNGLLGGPQFISPYSEPSIGYNTGQIAFSKYHFTLDDFKLLDINRGIADAHYSIAGQENSLFEINFGRNYGKRLNQFRLEYKRINQDGRFQRQKALNTHFRAGITSQSMRNRLFTAILLSSNLITQQDNGGVTSIENAKNPVGGLTANVPVQLGAADTRQHVWNYTLLNRFTLDRITPDSTFIPTRFTFYHGLHYDTRLNRFLDEADPDAEIHGRFSTALNSTADSISHFLSLKRLTSEQGIQFQSLNGEWIFDLGMNVRTQWIDQRGANFRRNNFLPFAKLIKHSKNYRLDVNGTVSISTTRPEYDINGRLSNIRLLNNRFQLNIGGQLKAQSTDHIQEYIILNNQIVDVYSPETTFRNKLFGNLRFNENISLHVFGEFLSNMIYWDADYRRQINSATISIAGARLEYRDNAGWLRYRFWAQSTAISDENLYRVPTLQVFGNLSSVFRLFKGNLEINAGIDVWSDNGRRDIGYYPGLSIFYLADTQHYETWYPDATFYLETQIGSFRFYYLFENIFQRISTQSGNPNTQFQLSAQPIQPYRTRIGLRWVFRN